jgi:vacuolar-type H+-ATPase subunit I/STV1
VNKISETIKNWLPIVKIIQYITIVIIVLYFAIQLFTTNREISSDFKAQLDSLQKVTVTLQKQQKSYDSTLSIEQEKIKELDYQIDNVKEKTTIIKEYYHEQSKAADSYTPTQLDSFFAKRYGY